MTALLSPGRNVVARLNGNATAENAAIRFGPFSGSAIGSNSPRPMP
jgi:hypothetical protein